MTNNQLVLWKYLNVSNTKPIDFFFGQKYHYYIWVSNANEYVSIVFFNIPVSQDTL